MKRRDKHFVDALVRAVATGGGNLGDDQLITAYLASHGLGFIHMGDEQKRRLAALNRAKEKLQLPDIREALRELYETVDFDVLEAAQLHVEHIRGITYEIPVRDKKGDPVLTAEGEVLTVQVRDKPSYEALKDYLKVAVPQPALRVDKRVLIGNVGRTPAPAIAARSIADDVDAEFSETT